MSFRDFFDRNLENLKNSLVSNGCPEQYANVVARNVRNDFYSQLIDDPDMYFQWHLCFNLSKQPDSGCNAL